MLAGQVGSGEQLAVVHAAGQVHVGAVVPLAHTLAAQAQGNGGQRALQAGVGAGALFLLRRQGLRRGGRDDGQAKFFLRQHRVKTPHAGQALQRLASLSALSLGAARLQQRTGTPVNPGAVAGGVCTHGVDAVQRVLPLVLAQRSAGAPGQMVITHALGAGALEIAQGAVREFQRCLLANGPPGPGALLWAERLAPALVERLRGTVRVSICPADQGQHRQLLRLALG